MTPTEIKLRRKSRVLEVAFDDGHDSGIYTWDYLHELGSTFGEKWFRYLERLAKLGLPYPTPVPQRKKL